MAKRQMPTAGFYVYNHHDNPCNNCDGTLYKEIIKTTGIRGSGGHKYWRSDHSRNMPPPNNPDEWTTLTWTCVPGKETINDYVYFDNLEKALEFYNS